MKLWSELYVNFVRLSSLVASAEPNVACEQLTAKILSFMQQITAEVC